ncbi:MAG: hypothetical protein LBU36_05580 [Clostridiales bacterium]|jgi:cell division protein YceG involved in septum cleavage|nr:hypothetical protein [Clostridiales bacterium]
MYNKFLSALGFIFGSATHLALSLATAFLMFLAARRGYEAGFKYMKDAGAERPYREVAVTLAAPTRLFDAAKILEENGLVHSAYIYAAEYTLKGSFEPYKAGTYDLNTQMGSSEINKVLRSGADKPGEKT